MSGLGRSALAVALSLALCGVAVPARAQEFVVDLSEHLIAITADFTGARVVLFGVKEGEGDVVVVVRGPESRTVVRRKGNVAGIWANRDSLVFERAPAYYMLAASRPLDEFLTFDAREFNQIGVDHLELAPEGSPNIGQRQLFLNALVRIKRQDGLYPEDVAPVSFLGPSLFRAVLRFPANVPIGNYTVQAFLVRDGRVVQGVQTPLSISKAGLEAEFYRFAHRHAALYGLIAILVALSAGWLGHAAFRR